MKICKDCAHSRPMYGVLECYAPQSYEPDSVYGDPIRRFTMCSSQREDGWLSCRMLNTCGAEARWFQPKLNDEDTIPETAGGA